jgi:hypothetical protein
MDKLQIDHLRQFVERDTASSWYKATVLRLLDELESLTLQRDTLYVESMKGGEDK